MSISEMLPKAIHISVIKHLPATLGIILGILLGMPAYWVMQFGEIFLLIFYVYICYLSLKLMPIKKEVMALLMLFPMAIQQASSINYDAVLLPMCYLFIAYIFYLKFEKKKLQFIVCNCNVDMVCYYLHKNAIWSFGNAGIYYSVEKNKD